MYNENPDIFDDLTGQCATAQVCLNMELFGATPPTDEPDPRPAPNEEEAEDIITQSFEMWHNLMEDSCLDSELPDLLWNMVNVFQRKLQKLDKSFDALAWETRRCIKEQDGSDIKSHELETLQIRSHATCEARETFERLRDHAASCYHTLTNQPWMPARGSRASRTGLTTAAIVDSRDMLAAEQRRRTDSLIPEGTRVAIAGGTDHCDHKRVYAELDKVHTKYPNMVLLHGGANKGIDLIASKWAESRKVSQVVFKPDWTRHKKRAGFVRNEEMIAAAPIGLLAFPGSGVTENLIDRARTAGIIVRRYK